VIYDRDVEIAIMDTSDPQEGKYEVFVGCFITYKAASSIAGMPP